MENGRVQSCRCEGVFTRFAISEDNRRVFDTSSRVRVQLLLTAYNRLS